MKRILLIVGSRPEAIKLAPVWRSLRDLGSFDVRIVSTGQQQDLITGTLASFGIVADRELMTMIPGQSLGRLTARLMTVLDDLLAEWPADVVVVQGDTTSAMTGALAGFYRNAKVAHVEAGLRTLNPYSPFPEEINRRIISQCAAIHFAPTGTAMQNLLDEGVESERVFVTGNTVIDALFWMRRITEVCPPSVGNGLGVIVKQGRLILATMHRRENIGEGIRSVCEALLEIVEKRPDVHVILPVHPNPGVRSTVDTAFGGHPRIHLTAPLDYPVLVHLLAHAYIVVSDSGGLQEEAPALGKPVVVIRNTTERPEIIAAGGARLVGTACAAIVDVCSELLDDSEAYAQMAVARFPYGDGTAADKISSVISDLAVGLLSGPEYPGSPWLTPARADGA